MRIKINKDIEEAYENEAFKGFTLRQVLAVVLGLVVIAGVAVLAGTRAGLSPNVCVYIGLPFGIPVIVCGFVKIQGLTLFQYIHEMRYARRTKVLLYEADELPEYRRVFTMEQITAGKRKKRRRGR